MNRSKQIRKSNKSRNSRVLKHSQGHKQNLMKLFNKLLVDLHNTDLTSVDELLVEFNKFNSLVLPYIIKHNDDITIEKHIKRLFLLRLDDDALDFQHVLIQFITNCVLRGKISKNIYHHLTTLSITPVQKQTMATLDLRYILNKIARVFYINQNIIDSSIISQYQSIINPSFLQKMAGIIHISYLTVNADDIIKILPDTDFTLCVCQLCNCIRVLSNTLLDDDYKKVVIIAGLLFYFELIYGLQK